VQLGALREAFSGTDALAMDVQPKVLAWLGATPHTTVVAEGDRLANSMFFGAVQRLGWALTVACLATPDDLAGMRRAARGSTQHEAWLRGRATKVGRLAQQWVHPRWMLDGGLPLALLATHLAAHPVCATLRQPA
jgi:hypothetical protein